MHCSTSGTLRAVPKIILGGCRHFFSPVGGGCFVDNVCEGWRGVNLSWGSRHIWFIVGQGCPESRGALTPRVSWGWRGLKRNADPPGDNFWNSSKPRVSPSQFRDPEIPDTPCWNTLPYSRLLPGFLDIRVHASQQICNLWLCKTPGSIGY